MGTTAASMDDEAKCPTPAKPARTAVPHTAAKAASRPGLIASSLPSRPSLIRVRDGLLFRFPFGRQGIGQNRASKGKPAPSGPFSKTVVKIQLNSGRAV